MAANRDSRRTRARVVAGVVLVVLILMLFGLGVVLVNVLQPPGAPKAGSLADDVTWVRSIYGFGPRPEQQLFEPIGVAVDGEGRIYVSEPQRSRVVVFKRDGSFDAVITLMKSHDVALARPAGLDLDAAGNLYVVDEPMDRIVVFGADHSYRRMIKVDSGTTGVKIVGDRLYALQRSRIGIYNLKGELLSSFGETGRKEGQLDGAYALDVGGDGLIYVADSFNKRVTVFKPNGDYVRTIVRPAKAESVGTSETAGAAKEDTSQPMFDLPTGIVFDGAGRLVELDAFQFGVSVFTTAGKTVTSYSNPGTDDGQFIYPSGLAYDRAGDVFVVTDTRNNRVQVLRISGSGRTRFDRLVPLTFMQPICYGPLALLVVALVAAVLLGRRARAERPAEAPEEVQILTEA